MSNEELVLMIQNGKDAGRNIEQLYLQNIGLIQKAASRYSGIAEKEDLIQEAFFGLIQAVKLYDPEAGASFSSYAFGWIRQTMVRYIEKSASCLRLPAHRQQRIQKYRKTVNLFKMEWNRNPTAEELASALELTISQVEQVKADIEALKTQSLNTPITAEDGNETEYGDFK